MSHINSILSNFIQITPNHTIRHFTEQNTFSLPSPTLLFCHLFPEDLTTIYTRPHVIPNMTVISTHLLSHPHSYLLVYCVNHFAMFTPGVHITIQGPKVEIFGNAVGPILVWKLRGCILIWFGTKRLLLTMTKTLGLVNHNLTPSCECKYWTCRRSKKRNPCYDFSPLSFLTIRSIVLN